MQTILDATGELKTFGQRGPEDLLEKLHWERALVDEYAGHNSQFATFALLNAFASCCHMLEWVWVALENSPKRPAETEKAYREAAVNRCPELRVADQIGNAGKHRRKTRNGDKYLRTGHGIRHVLSARVPNPPIRIKLRFKATVITPDSERDARDILDTIISFWDREIIEARRLIDE